MKTSITLFGGNTFDYASPSLVGVEIHTLFHHLSNINRFSGATFRTYSVAEHSLLTKKIAQILCEASGYSESYSATVMKAALLHDLHEAVLGDLPTPLKNTILFKSFEDGIQVHFSHHYGYLTDRTLPLVKRCDQIALAVETRYFFERSLNTFPSITLTYLEDKLVKRLVKSFFKPYYPPYYYADYMQESHNELCAIEDNSICPD